MKPPSHGQGKTVFGGVCVELKEFHRNAGNRSQYQTEPLRFNWSYQHNLLGKLRNKWHAPPMEGKYLTIHMQQDRNIVWETSCFLSNSLWFLQKALTVLLSTSGYSPTVAQLQVPCHRGSCLEPCTKLCSYSYTTKSHLNEKRHRESPFTFSALL